MDALADCITFQDPIRRAARMRGCAVFVDRQLLGSYGRQKRALSAHAISVRYLEPRASVGETDPRKRIA